MRLMQLSAMLTELRSEARISADILHGNHLQPRYVALLARVQEEVYDAYNWPGLVTSGTVTLAPRQRYAAYPEQLSFGGIRKVFQKNTTGDWFELTYGIDIQDLNKTDSDSGKTQENPLKWANYLSPQAEEINENMFEVWPVPDRETVLRFGGKRKLLPLFDTAKDRSTVDGIVVVLHAAAELLAANKAEDAGLKLQKAQARFDQLKVNQTSPDNRRMFLSSGREGLPDPRASGQRFRV